jgi:hypothetical protein
MARRLVASGFLKVGSENLGVLALAENGAAGDEPDLSLLQVATLRDNDQVALIGSDLVWLGADRGSWAEDRDRTARARTV